MAITITKKNPKLEGTLQVIADRAGIQESSKETTGGSRDFVYDYWLELEGHRLSKKALNKFSKMIVKECVDLVNKHVQFNNPNDCLLALKIKEHFGVQDD